MSSLGGNLVGEGDTVGSVHLRDRRIAMVVVVGVVALVATLVTGSKSSAAITEVLPTPMVPFPVCTSTTQVMCVEYAEWIDDAGTVTDVYSETAAQSTTQVWRTYAGPGTGADGGRTLEMFVGPRNELPIPVRPGIPDGLYRSAVRTGAWDPSMSMVSAHVVSHSVTGDETSGYRLELEVRPTAQAYASASVCSPVQWTCRAEFMTEAAIVIGVTRYLDEPYASNIRGLYYSANAIGYGTPTYDKTTRIFRFSGFAPHLLPASYGNGNEINPGFYDVFIPKAMLENEFGMSMDTITMDSFVQDSSTPLAPASIVKSSHGILFKTGVTHWSMNDPGIQFRPWPTIDLETTSAQFVAHMGPGPDMTQLPTGDVVFAACRDAACVDVDLETAVSATLRANSATATARIARTALPLGAPNYRAYYPGDADYPEGARAFSGSVDGVEVAPNFAG